MGLSKEQAHRYKNLPATGEGRAKLTLHWGVSLEKTPIIGASPNKQQEFAELEYANLLDVKEATGFGNVTLVLTDDLQIYNKLMADPEFITRLNTFMKGETFNETAKTQLNKRTSGVLSVALSAITDQIDILIRELSPRICQECKVLSDNWLEQFYTWYVKKANKRDLGLNRQFKSLNPQQKVAAAIEVLNRHGIEVKYWSDFKPLFADNKFQFDFLRHQGYQDALHKSVTKRLAAKMNSKQESSPVAVPEYVAHYLAKSFAVEEDMVIAKVHESGGFWMYKFPIEDDLYCRQRAFLDNFASLRSTSELKPDSVATPDTMPFLEFSFSEAIERKYQRIRSYQKVPPVKAKSYSATSAEESRNMKSESEPMDSVESQHTGAALIDEVVSFVGGQQAASAGMKRSPEYQAMEDLRTIENATKRLRGYLLKEPAPVAQRLFDQSRPSRTPIIKLPSSPTESLAQPQKQAPQSSVQTRSKARDEEQHTAGRVQSAYSFLATKPQLRAAKRPRDDGDGGTQPERATKIPSATQLTPGMSQLGFDSESANGSPPHAEQSSSNHYDLRRRADSLGFQ